jgi:hypothetical protein
MTDLLQEIGFQPTMTEGGMGYRLLSDHLELSALRCSSIQHGEIVSLAGHYKPPRKAGLIEYPLPEEVETRELGLAYLAYALRSTSWGDVEPEWLVVGREHAHLLPWERQRAAYEARPRCKVKRDWLRLALRTLSEGIASEPTASPILFAFDGTTLSIRCGSVFVALPAEGAAWQTPYLLITEAPFVRPARLMGPDIEISFFGGKLAIDRYRYAGASSLPPTEPLETQHE